MLVLNRTARALQRQLDRWLDKAAGSMRPDACTPAGAQVIIAPHAGYAYSGPCAAYAYAAVDASIINPSTRVFLLGPSHHYHFEGCALSSFAGYGTPLGNLDIDQSVYAELQGTGRFDAMSRRADEAEHSLELHLPYIYRTFSRSDPSRADEGRLSTDLPYSRKPDLLPLVVPVLVGTLTDQLGERYGKLFATYLQDSGNLFIFSSDFCHWGKRFQYTYYDDGSGAKNLRSDSSVGSVPVYVSIEKLDRQGMKLIEAGSLKDFTQYLKTTNNTICGRYPITILLAALSLTPPRRGIKFSQYQQSSQATNVHDSSVSYASGNAVV